MKTEFLKVEIDWNEVKNECRHTVNKEDSDKETSREFIKKILISEHSPIRLPKIKWRWSGIKSWITVHYARHWLGWEKWVQTRRTDRTGVDRNSLRQDELLNMDIEANPQSLINVSGFRLCHQAADETREDMEDLKVSIKEELNEKELSDVMVPRCIAKLGCPELQCCGLIHRFLKWCKDNNKESDLMDMINIQKRYDLYNEWFYDERE